MRIKRKKKKLEKRKNINIKTVVRQIVLIVLAVILGVNLYTLNASRLLGNQLPMPFGYGAAVVLSGSMEPTLSVDDLIIVREEDNYQVGDIVVYQDGGTLIVHRIVSADGDTIVTQGDANNVPDAAIHKISIKGKMVASIPGIGMIVNSMKSPVGTILVIAIAVLLVEGSYRKEQQKHNDELESIKEEIRRLKEEEEHENKEP